MLVIQLFTSDKNDSQKCENYSQPLRFGFNANCKTETSTLPLYLPVNSSTMLNLNFLYKLIALIFVLATNNQALSPIIGKICFSNIVPIPLP